MGFALLDNLSHSPARRGLAARGESPHSDVDDRVFGMCCRLVVERRITRIRGPDARRSGPEPPRERDERADDRSKTSLEASVPGCRRIRSATTMTVPDFFMVVPFLRLRPQAFPSGRISRPAGSRRFKFQQLVEIWLWRSGTSSPMADCIRSRMRRAMSAVTRPARSSSSSRSTDSRTVSGSPSASPGC